MKIKGKRDSNELQIKITWVLDSDSSETEFQFSIHFNGHVHIGSLKNTLICAYTQFFTVSCITMEFIYTYSFYGTLLVCVKERESKTCMWKLNWEGRETLKQDPSRKKTQVKTLTILPESQHLLRHAVK